jgi:tetratricopeptide (TPR) repeat protein
MTARKLTRKELLRQDEFLTTMEKAQQFWEEHRNFILIGIAAVAVLVILVVGGISFWKAREAKGAALLSEALRPYHGVVLGQQTQTPDMANDDQMQFSSDAEKFQASITALDGVVDNYGGTEAGRVARLYRAHSLFNLGRYAEALEEYQSFRDAYGNGYLSGLALLNMAQCRKQEGDYPAAAATYQELIDTASELQFPLDTALIALADCRLENGEQEEAAILYRRVLDEFPESAYRLIAEEKLGGLGIDDIVSSLNVAQTLE